jgi:hypothetical protein
MKEIRKTCTSNKKMQDVLLFDQHVPRECPIEGDFPFLAGEVAALMNRYEKRLLEQDESYTAKLEKDAIILAQLAQLVFQLDISLKGLEPDITTRHEFIRIRIIKDQLKTHLLSNGISWHDPTGEILTKQLEAVVEVHEWQHSERFKHEEIIETKQPIIYYKGKCVLRGIVVVGGAEI